MGRKKEHARRSGSGEGGEERNEVFAEVLELRTPSCVPGRMERYKLYLGVFECEEEDEYRC
jgi:hypothetical protein